MTRQVAGRVVVITGPTASGKTQAALELAAQLHNVRLISADSAMVYRGMDIGTAKPAAQILREFPHELIDIRDPAEVYSAAEFVSDADRVVEDALAAGEQPVIVGGTMLYLKCFRDGIAALPDAAPELREQLAAELEERGADALHAELMQVDPVAAAGIHPNNTQRLLRALEVYRLTGVPMSELWNDQESAAARLGVDVRTFALVEPDRGVLHGRIESRFDAMLAAGFVDEVRELRTRDDLHLDLPSMRAVGYRQAWRHLTGELTLDEFRAQALAATRQLAKRQMTWLNAWPYVERLQVAESTGLASLLVR